MCVLFLVGLIIGVGVTLVYQRCITFSERNMGSFTVGKYHMTYRQIQNVDGKAVYVFTSPVNLIKAPVPEPVTPTTDVAPPVPQPTPPVPQAATPAPVPPAPEAPVEKETP